MIIASIASTFRIFISINTLISKDRKLVPSIISGVMKEFLSMPTLDVRLTSY